MGTVETQVVQAAAGLLALVVSYALTAFTQHAKTFIKNHTNAHTASVANDVIDGLAKIANTVVADFNTRVVAQAKANGVFTPQAAQDVKKAAVQAVMDQGSQLVTLGLSTIGNVQSLIESMIEQSVTFQKSQGNVQITHNMNFNNSTDGLNNAVAHAITTSVQASPTA